MKHVLVESVEQLRELVAPVLAGDVGQVVLDTETSEVVGERFTPYGTDTRVAGWSLSYGTDVDLYVPLRHRPYDWRRPARLVSGDAKHDGPEWVRRLLQVERVLPEEDGPGWQPGADPNVPLEPVWELLQALLDVEGVEWLAHNWPFDAKMLSVEGLRLPWDRMEDSQALSVHTDPRPVDAWDDSLNDGRGGYVHGGHGLKHLGETWLGVPADAQRLLDQARAALGPHGGNLSDWSMLPLRTAVAPYACMDTRLALKLTEHCRKRDAYQDSKVRELLRLHKVERRISCGMEEAGIPVDAEEAARRAEAKEREVAALSERCRQLAGVRVVPLSAPADLADMLYSELGLPSYRGIRNTEAATLKKVRTHMVARGEEPAGSISADDAVDLLDAILEWRRATKELTAFYRPLTQLGSGGRVHPVLSPLRARTTRFSAAAPNAMQMAKPKKAKEPEVARANQVASVRHLFKPEPGHVFVCADYNGQEMRVSAHYANAIPESFAYRFTWNCTMGKRGSCKGREGFREDGTAYPGNHGPKGDRDECRKVVHVGWRPNYSQRPPSMFLVDGFLSGNSDFDPHQAMVEWCVREGLKEIDRDKGKTADFAALYGAGAKKLSETLDCSMDVAYRILDIFWDKAYPELGRVRLFIQERLRRCGKETAFSHQPFIRTLHGGRIYLRGSFKGPNYIVQRSCREILLQAIVGCDEYVRENCPSYKLVLPVHDELIWHVPEADLEEAHVRNICRIMVAAGRASSVPMVVEPNVCRESWAVKEKLPGWGWDGVNQGVPDVEVESWSPSS